MTRHMKICKHGLSSESDILYHVITEWHGKVLIDDLITRYVDQELCCDDLRKMGYEFLSNYLKIAGLKRSNSDEKKTQRYSNKYKTTLIERYGTDNVSKLESVKDKKNETYMRTYGSYDAYLEYRSNVLSKGYREYINNVKWDEETLRRKARLYEKYGVYNVSQIPTIRTKIASTKKLKFKSMTLDEKRIMTEKARSSVKHRGGFRSKLEVRIENILTKLSMEFDTNVSLFGYNYDFVINEHVILEINGDMWHGNPALYSPGDYVFSGRILVDTLWDKDERKKKICIDNGYKFVVLWESDIRSMTDTEIEQTILTQI